jgi:hypothetical protein
MLIVGTLGRMDQKYFNPNAVRAKRFPFFANTFSTGTIVPFQYLDYSDRIPNLFLNPFLRYKYFILIIIPAFLG